METSDSIQEELEQLSLVTMRACRHLMGLLNRVDTPYLDDGKKIDPDFPKLLKNSYEMLRLTTESNAEAGETGENEPMAKTLLIEGLDMERV